MARELDIKNSKWEQKYREYLKHIVLENYDIYIAVTRKGYYFSMLVEEDLKVKLLRDRDILKRYTFDEFAGKRILLFDDTANTGETLKKIKAVLKEKTTAKAIDVAAFAIGYYILENKNTLFDDSKFYFQYLFSEDEMMDFSLYELQRIHDSMISYVIDLPVFNKIEITREQFEKLTGKNKNNWDFYSYSFQLKEQEYNNGFFVYENSMFKRIFGGSLLENIVKCRYCLKKGTSDVYEVVLTPFTMLKSVNESEMKECFLKIYQGTYYSQYIENNKMKDYYIGIYRDVVYNLSFFVGHMFQKYMKSEYDIELTWRYNLTESEQNKKLEESINAIFDDFSIEDYMNRLNQCRFTYTRKTEIKINSEAATNCKMVMDYVLGVFSLQKVVEVNRKIHSRDSQKEQEINSMLCEDIESLIAKKFDFRSEKDFYLSFIQTILVALDCSFMSNGLVKEAEKGQIKRIFTFGECSESYFGYDIQLFYLAIYSYYNVLRASNKEYQKYYRIFIQQLYNYLQNNDYFKLNYISIESFNYFSDYFDLNEEMVDREIRNKKFLLDSEYRKNPYSVAVMKFVSNLKFD